MVRTDHYEATLERTDQTGESTEVSDEEALVVASQEREQVSIEVAPQEKEGRGHRSLCVVASQERKAVDVASQEEEADADVAPRERKEKEG